MANLLRGDPSHSAAPSTEASCKRLDEPDHSMSNWYFAREYIDKSSPSGIDGMDAKKEAYLRRSFCTYLQDLGMRLKMPQVTIATAIVFCHRFFIRQSHARNDRFTIATSCMFLAGKVEETPKQLKDVIFVSYEIRHKKDSDAVQRIKQKEVYEEQKERILMGERLVLATLGFDLNIQHPYKPLVAAIKKFKVSQSQLAQVAWNFVNDGLRTSLCLQFKPHHIAAGAIFLGAKFLKVKLPSEGGVAWWQEFDVTPRQLEEVSNQMLELYEHNKEGPSSRASGEPSPSPAGGCSNGKSSGSNGPSSTPATPVVVPATPALIVRNTFGGNTMKQPKTLEKRDDEQQITRESNASLNRARVDTHKPKLESISDNNNHDTALKDNIASNSLLPESPKKNGLVKEDEKVEKKGDASDGEFNKDKLRALLEKRRRQRAETGDTKAHSAAAGSVLTDEELLERDLENGVEVVAKGTSDDGILRKRKRGVDDDGRGGGVREMMEAADNCKDVGHATPLNSELAVTISNQPDTGGINQNGNNATNEKHWYPHGCDQSTDAALPKDRGDLQDKDCKKDRYVTEK